MPVRSVRVLLVAVAAPVLCAVGCSHRDPADRSIEQLKADIAKLQADRDRIDQRLGLLEAADQERRPTRPATAPASDGGPEKVPRLPVVRVGERDPEPSPPGEGEVSDTEVGAGDPRPMVQANGPPSFAKRGRAGSRADATAFSPEAKREYDSALALVRSRQYDRALDALTTFVVRYPDHPYAENATYWRGECFYAKGDYAKAAEQFEGLMARFPYGNKAPDALLKLGLAQQRLGAQDQAQKTFSELRDRYPKSEAARQVARP